MPCRGALPAGSCLGRCRRPAVDPWERDGLGEAAGEPPPAGLRRPLGM